MTQTYFERITFEPQIMGGKACIRGMRITVSLVLSLIANDMTTEEILEEYPDLEAEDIKACLRYAASKDNDFLGTVMDQISDRAQERGLTPEILESIQHLTLTMGLK